MNMLKSDLYRLFRNKFFYISLLLSAATIIVYLNFDYTNRYVHDLSSLSDKLYKNYSISISVLFFMATYASQEFNYGVLRCFVSRGISRIQIYVAKFVTCTLAVSIIVSFGTLCGMVAGNVFWGSFANVSTESIQLVIIQYLMEIILHIAFASLMLSVIYMFGKSQISTLVNTGLLIFGYAVLRSIQTIIDTKWNLYNFWIGALIDISQTDNSKYWRCFELSIALLYIIFFGALGLMIFRKKELK